MTKESSSFKNFYLFIIIFWLRWVFVAARGLSLVSASEGYSSLRCPAFSPRWLLLLQSMGYRHMGLSSCSMQAQQLWLAGSIVQAHQLWHTGLVAPWHMGSSWTRGRTRVPFIGRQILFFKKFYLFFGYVGSSLLYVGFLQLWRVGATLRCSARASHCGGFSCCGAWALGAWASVVAACGLSSCSS